MENFNFNCPNKKNIIYYYIRENLMYCKIVIICHYNIIFPSTDLKQ